MQNLLWASALADPTGIEPAESTVAVVETPSVTPARKSADGEKKVLKPLVDQGEQTINLHTASAEQLRMQLAILEKEESNQTSNAGATKKRRRR